MKFFTELEKNILKFSGNKQTSNSHYQWLVAEGTMLHSKKTPFWEHKAGMEVKDPEINPNKSHPIFDSTVKNCGEDPTAFLDFQSRRMKADPYPILYKNQFKIQGP